MEGTSDVIRAFGKSTQAELYKGRGQVFDYWDKSFRQEVECSVHSTSIY